jgi:hypothetical protein
MVVFSMVVSWKAAPLFGAGDAAVKQLDDAPALS